jgi:hypothetical protein
MTRFDPVSERHGDVMDLEVEWRKSIKKRKFDDLAAPPQQPLLVDFNNQEDSLQYRFFQIFDPTWSSDPIIETVKFSTKLITC